MVDDWLVFIFVIQNNQNTYIDIDIMVGSGIHQETNPTNLEPDQKQLGRCVDKPG